MKTIKKKSKKNCVETHVVLDSKAQNDLLSLLSHLRPRVSNNPNCLELVPWIDRWLEMLNEVSHRKVIALMDNVLK